MSDYYTFLFLMKGHLLGYSSQDREDIGKGGLGKLILFTLSFQERSPDLNLLDSENTVLLVHAICYPVCMRIVLATVQESCIVLAVLFVLSI